MPHGFGKLTWPNGDYYEGNFKNGKRNGKGRRVNIDNSEYNGEYVDDKPHGRGNIKLERCRVDRFVYLEGWRAVRRGMEEWEVSW